jgi:hypothetical protein
MGMVFQTTFILSRRSPISMLAVHAYALAA